VKRFTPLLIDAAGALRVIGGSSMRVCQRRRAMGSICAERSTGLGRY
jgi:hypothetical protein